MKSSIIDYTMELIKVPSQAEIDNNENILNYIYKWNQEKKIDCKFLYDENNVKSAILIEVKGKTSNNHYCFNACSDTAQFGDLSKWDFPPSSATIDNDYLYGRGSSDSKIAISIFSHIAKELLSNKDTLNGQVDFLFDGDEHTGNFTGVKSYLKYLNGKKLNGAFIGYPGNDEIVIGARGFYRTKITLFGDMEHSGSRKTKGINSIIKATHLINKLNNHKFVEENDPYFKFEPKITVTKIYGGEGFAVTPNKCIINVDVRLTPGFDIENAEITIKNIVFEIDNNYPTYRESTIEECSKASSYRIDENSHFVKVLLENATKQFNKSIPLSVCGPSNIGNLLYKNGINATCGFGVTFDNLHSFNERIYIPTIDEVYSTYLNTIVQLTT